MSIKEKVLDEIGYLQPQRKHWVEVAIDLTIKECNKIISDLIYIEMNKDIEILRKNPKLLGTEFSMRWNNFRDEMRKNVL